MSGVLSGGGWGWVGSAGGISGWGWAGGVYGEEDFTSVQIALRLVEVEILCVVQAETMPLI